MAAPSPEEREFVARIGLFRETRAVTGRSHTSTGRMRCSQAAARKADSDPPR